MVSADRTRRQKAPPPRSATLRARVVDQVTLEADAAGRIAASFAGQRVDLGAFDAATAARVGELRRGLNLDAASDQAMHGLARRLAASGLLEYCLGSDDHDEVVIEPQLPDYWPRLCLLDDTGVFALSRFAYLRGAAPRWCWNCRVPARCSGFAIQNSGGDAALSPPQSIAQLRSREDYAGDGLLGLLVDCRIVDAVDRVATAASGERGRRRSRALGFPRSRVSRAQHAGPPRQSGRRYLRACRRYSAAARGAAALAREMIDLKSSRRRLPRRRRLSLRRPRASSFDPGFRRPASGHVRGACAVSRHHGVRAVGVEGRRRRRR